MSVLGVTRALLLCAVIENVIPQRVRRFSDFIEQKITQDLLSIIEYYIDRVDVQHTLFSFTTVQLIETRNKYLYRHSAACRIAKVLQDHFSGERSMSMRIERSEKLNASIHYKNE